MKLRLWLVAGMAFGGLTVGEWKCAGATNATTNASFLPGVRRVVFAGDSITYDGRYVTYFETFVRTRFPGRRIEFLDLGLPSETVSGLSEEGHAGGQFP